MGIEVWGEEGGLEGWERRPVSVHSAFGRLACLNADPCLSVGALSFEAAVVIPSAPRTGYVTARGHISGRLIGRVIRSQGRDVAERAGYPPCDSPRPVEELSLIHI